MLQTTQTASILHLPAPKRIGKPLQRAKTPSCRKSSVAQLIKESEAAARAVSRTRAAEAAIEAKHPDLELSEGRPLLFMGKSPSGRALFGRWEGDFTNAFPDATKKEIKAFLKLASEALPAYRELRRRTGYERAHGRSNHAWQTARAAMRRVVMTEPKNLQEAAMIADHLLTQLAKLLEGRVFGSTSGYDEYLAQKERRFQACRYLQSALSKLAASGGRQSRPR